ncbi:MAG: hypothetical protein M3O41_01460, partial [Pseudomonadota bacterium]|nr:hypothetical protein [Pseudomonadota bacterium]
AGVLTSAPVGLPGDVPVSAPPGVPAGTPGTTLSLSRGSERNAFLLDVTEIESLERRLAYHVGPVAKYLVKRAASKAVNREELTQLLAAEVEAAPARKQFFEACRSSLSVRRSALRFAR